MQEVVVGDIMISNEKELFPNLYLFFFINAEIFSQSHQTDVLPKEWRHICKPQPHPGNGIDTVTSLQQS